MVRQTMGQRFETQEGIEAFLNTMKRQQNSTPFLHNTMIVDCNVTPDYQRLSQVFPTLAQKHGQHVWNLIYCIHPDIPESMANIRAIFQNMVNLRSVIIIMMLYPGEEKLSQELEQLNFVNFPDLPHFCELELIGNFGDKNPVLLTKIGSRYGNQMQSLTISGYEETRHWNAAIAMYSNLSNFKLIGRPLQKNLEVSPQNLVRRSPRNLVGRSPWNLVPPPRIVRWKRWPPAKIVAFKPTPNALINHQTDEFLSCVTLFKNTVEQLNIDIPKFTFRPLADCRVLREVAIPFSSLVNAESFSMIPFSGLPVLNCVILNDTKNLFQNMDMSDDEIAAICKPLWDQVPLSVDIMSICTRKKNPVRKGFVAVTFSCKRVGVNGN